MSILNFYTTIVTTDNFIITIIILNFFNLFLHNINDRSNIYYEYYV